MFLRKGGEMVKSNGEDFCELGFMREGSRRFPCDLEFERVIMREREDVTHMVTKRLFWLFFIEKLENILFITIYNF